MSTSCRSGFTYRAFWAVVFGLWLTSVPGVRALLPEHPQIHRAPEPRWKQKVAFDVEAEPPANGDLDATYLLVDRQISLPARGPTEDSERYVYRVENRSALEQWSSWQIDFDPSFQQLTVHHLRIFRNGEWHDRLESSRSSLLHREDDLHRQIYDQRLTLVLIFDDVRPGDVVDLAYTRTGDNPVFRGRYVGYSTLLWSRAMAKYHLSLTAAAGRNIRVEILGDGPEPQVFDLAETRSWVWDLDTVPEVEYENNTPEDTTQFAFAQFSEFASWADVVDWAVPIYDAGFIPTPELRGVADRLLQEFPDPLARLVAARDWVQGDIRYFAVLMGKHSHAPHKTSEILQRRYGDCKDKSILLVSLLRLLGIEAFPAFVRSDLGSGITTWLPSPTAFDHAIVMARSGGREIWIDPTLTYQGGQLDGGSELVVPDYGVGLVLEPGTESLREIPAAQTDPGSTTVRYRYDIAGRVDRTLSDRATYIEIVTRYDRAQAENMRRLLSSTTPEDLLDSYVEHYTSESLQIEPLQALEILDQRSANHLSITERYKATYLPSSDTDTTLVDTLPLLLSSDLPIPGLEELKRRHPYAIPHPVERLETIELMVPADFDLEPVEAEEINEWFRFAVTTEPLGGSTLEGPGPGQERTGLALTYHLETLTDRVANDRVEDFRDAAQRLTEHLGYSIWDRDATVESLESLARRGLLVSFVCLILLTWLVAKLLRRYGLLG